MIVCDPLSFTLHAKVDDDNHQHDGLATNANREVNLLLEAPTAAGDDTLTGPTPLPGDSFGDAVLDFHDMITIEEEDEEELVEQITNVFTNDEFANNFTGSSPMSSPTPSEQFLLNDHVDSPPGAVETKESYSEDEGTGEVDHAIDELTLAATPSKHPGLFTLDDAANESYSSEVEDHAYQGGETVAGKVKVDEVEHTSDELTLADTLSKHPGFFASNDAGSNSGNTESAISTPLLMQKMDSFVPELSAALIGAARSAISPSGALSTLGSIWTPNRTDVPAQARGSLDADPERVAATAKPVAHKDQPNNAGDEDELVASPVAEPEAGAELGVYYGPNDGRLAKAGAKPGAYGTVDGRGPKDGRVVEAGGGAYKYKPVDERVVKAGAKAKKPKAGANRAAKPATPPQTPTRRSKRNATKKSSIV